MIQSNKNPSFGFQKHLIYCILNSPLYNTTLCSILHGLVSEEYFTTANCEKYSLICSIEAHEKNIKSVNKHKPVNYETGSGDGIPLTSNSTEEALKSFVLTINYIQSWIESFKSNYKNLKAMFCEDIIEFFHKIPVALTKPVGFINKRKMLLTDI